MAEPFESVWQKIEAHQGELFHTIRGLQFTYDVRSNQVIPKRTYYPPFIWSISARHMRLEE